LSDVEARVKSTLPATNSWHGAIASVRAVLAARRGNSAQALKLADESIRMIEISMRSGGQGADFLPIALLRRSEIRFGAGRYDEAHADAVSAEEKFAAGINAGDFSSYVGQAQLAQARALQAAGKPGEAQIALHAAAAQLQSTLGPEHPDTRRAQQMATLSSKPGSYGRHV